MSTKAHYGTSKYCKKFLEGRDCRNNKCNLLHYEEDWNVDKQDLSASLEDQFEEIHDIIKSNVPYYIEKEFAEHRNKGKNTNFVLC